MLSDNHCHCDFSIDAKGTLEEYCEVALKKGLAELTFTTHYDVNPNGDQSFNKILIDGERKPATPGSLAVYVEAVKRVAEQFYPLGLTVKTGVEFGWFPECDEVVIDLKKRFNFDYMLCGIHEINDACFCSRHTFGECFDAYSLEEMLEVYFGHVIEAVQTGVFDTIAHLDYYKKFGLEYYGEELHAAQKQFTPDVFVALKQFGVCLEINTAAMRIGLDSYYPAIDIVNDAKRAGVDVRYLGSDAHRPADVGFDFDIVASLITPLVLSNEE